MKMNVKVQEDLKERIRQRLGVPREMVRLSEVRGLWQRIVSKDRKLSEVNNTQLQFYFSQ